ncbi:efflux transporter outer membrane subunit [Burkholderia sp. Ac-20353]|uniref:efflux transporter outer membrane subunit n=1 Tax=Burkholderia sp. Ac-20353 TaxID=2703894 RepID=UPI00197B6EC5|nr:efflux transporter outer membrane subunit [Burkholderia sp. Ac-20353]MBN3788068.1 efflux transporter outer membrane subunit [Burkholderia sp. Ac-20353]
MLRSDGPPPRRAPRRKSIHGLIAVTLLAASLAGCSFVPTYRRPAPPAPAGWNDAAQTSLAGTVPVTSGWWRSYGDAALDTLVERGLQHNYSLASALASVDEARANAEKAGAPLYPSLTLNGTFDRSHRRSASSGSSNSGGASRSQSLFAEASYEIDFWGRNAATANAAGTLAQAAGFDRDTVALTLTASIVDTYFQVQSVRERVALAQSISANAARILALLQAQQAAGVATELQVQQQRNALATFQATIPALRQQLDQNLHLLATLVGAAPEGFDVAPAPLAGIAVPQPRPNLPATLLDTRPDIRASEARLQAANYDVGAARAAFFPNLVLTADGGLSSSALSHFLSSPFASVAAALTAPIFDGGALRGQLHASEAASAKSVADYRQTIVAALQDVEDMLSAASQQQQVESADQQAADAAAKAAQLADAQYRSGTVDFLTVLDTQRTRYQSEDTLVQTRLARLQASVGLFRAFGGGFGVTQAPPALASAAGPAAPSVPSSSSIAP